MEVYPQHYMNKFTTTNCSLCGNKHPLYQMRCNPHDARFLICPICNDDI